MSDKKKKEPEVTDVDDTTVDTHKMYLTAPDITDPESLYVSTKDVQTVSLEPTEMDVIRQILPLMSNYPCYDEKYRRYMRFYYEIYGVKSDDILWIMVSRPDQISVHIRLDHVCRDLTIPYDVKAVSDVIDHFYRRELPNYPDEMDHFYHGKYPGDSDETTSP